MEWRTSPNHSEFLSRLGGALVNGLYFLGYSMTDAAPDLGDSAITETAGLGGFALAAAPGIVSFAGGTPDDAIANTALMDHITLGRNGALTLPAMDFFGTPAAGIDAHKVVDTGILPVVKTGIAHRELALARSAQESREYRSNASLERKPRSQPR